VQAQQLTLYVDGYFTSVWDASCFVTLIEKQLEFTTARALLREGQGAPARLREQIPIARIPALQHGDLLLTESLAIVEYLEDAFAPPDHPRVLPAAPAARARARQIMSWLRFEHQALRAERPWQLSVYPAAIDPAEPLPPLSAEAERDAGALIDLAGWLTASGELAEWNIAHADLAFALWRIARCGYALSPAAQQLLDRSVERPSVRAYLEHPRPPNPPPRLRERWTS